LVNHLIQGSAADQTKESIIRYHKYNPKGRFLMTVHDENVISVRQEYLGETLSLLNHAMEDLEGFDVPFKVDSEQGENWHEMENIK
jgi:DNA polymerase-1